MKEIRTILADINEELTLEQMLNLSDVIQTLLYHYASAKYNKPCGQITSDELEQATEEIKFMQPSKLL